MLLFSDFIERFSIIFPGHKHLLPWEMTDNLKEVLYHMIANLDSQFNVQNGIAIHQKAMIEPGAVLKAPLMVDAHCFVGANAYLRGGVYLDKFVTIGPGCEIKTSIIFSESTIAHFNFIGDSIIGQEVNFEAGAHTANHHNDRSDKKIFALYQGTTLDTRTDKFGALVGDHSKIGANAVLSPGTLLTPRSVVKRLELVDQLNNKA